MSALNPNHPVTQKLDDQWHKILAMVMNQLGVTEVVITMKDLVALGDNENAVMAHDKADGLHIKLITMKEAEALASKHGGLPN